MEIPDFQLERFFAKYEFSARYLLSSSDCESLSQSDLLSTADTETIDLWENLKLGYTESWGHPLLLEEIANIYAGVDRSNILVIVPEEGIFLLMHALLEPGDHVVCPFPGYQSLYEVPRSIGCEVSTWEPDEDRGWHFAIEELQEIIKTNTKLVVVNFPHNPTGFIPSREEYISLVKLVQEQGAYLLSDEMYRFLEVAPDTTLPAACELYGKAISLFGLSKSFGLPGLRIGWLASQDSKVLRRVSRLKDYTTICSSAPSEILAIIALRNKTKIIDQQVKRVRKNVAALDNFFAKYNDHFSWQRPKGGSICFPRMLFVENTYSFSEKLVADEGIMLAPSRVFQYGDHHVRIGYGREDLPEVIEHFGEYLDRQ
jgi:aspartate/methionine/tyrosine aminotransferase